MSFHSRRLSCVLGFFAVVAVSFVTIFACTGKGNAKERPRFLFKEGQGPSGAVASINGKPINEDELLGDEKLEYFRMIYQIHSFKLQRINKLLLQSAYSEQAKKANLGVEDYIENKILKDPNVSEKEITKFAEDYGITKDKLNADLKSRISNRIKLDKRGEQLQDLIAKVSKENKVEIYFPKPNQRIQVDVGQAPTLGAKEAKVQIIEFSDFQCPYCKSAAKTLNELKKMYGKKVLVAFRNYPLPMHPQARPASEASMCIHEQSSDKYWKYHDLLFSNQDKLDIENLKKFAKEVGVKMDRFEQCFSSKKYASVVQEDFEYGNRIGVRSTPTIFINGRPIMGALPIDSLSEIVDEELSGS